jgi:hypothetical protein
VGTLGETDYPVITVRNSFHSNDGGSNTTDVYEVYDRFGGTKSQRWYRYGGTAWASPVHDAARNMTTIPETYLLGTSRYCSVCQTILRFGISPRGRTLRNGKR